MATRSSPRSARRRKCARALDFSDPYYRTPARFVARRDSPIEDVRPEALEGKKIAVVAGTAHEAYLKTLFTEAELHPYPDADAARFALKRGEVDLLFGDGVSLAFWLNGTDSANCCAFRGGPYHGKPLFRRRRRHCGADAATTCCGRHSTGRCSGCGKRAVSPICGCAIFPVSPF